MHLNITAMSKKLCISRTSSDFVLKNIQLHSNGKIMKEDTKYYIMRKMVNITSYYIAFPAYKVHQKRP
jgi:hypothetical protein